LYAAVAAIGRSAFDLNIRLLPEHGRRDIKDKYNGSEETMAENELKTAHELVALILEQSRNFDLHSVKVVPDPALGWVAVASSDNRFFQSGNSGAWAAPLLCFDLNSI
jgi:hypothetical protein